MISPPSNPLLRPALAPPPSFAVGRPRLIRKLRAGSQGRLTAIVGGAGSGKSVLLRQWCAAALDHQVSWLDVIPEVRDGVGLGHRLLAALGGAWGDIGTEALRRLESGGERMGQPFLEALVEEAEGRPETVLAIEDAHDLPTPLWEELVWFVERAPRSLHVVVTTRVELPGTNRLRARGELCEIGQADLALDRGEAAELVERVSGTALAPAELDHLWCRTEGWAVGVQLAAMAVRDRAEGVAVAEALEGVDRHVADYIAEEVIARQPPLIGEFLRRTSVLDRLCGPLCDVVTGGAEGQRVLAEVEQRTLFLSPVDATRTWYRYHPLVAEVLRQQLKLSDPALYRELLRRASRWHLDRGELEGAVEHLLTAEAWEEALDLITTHGWTMYERGQAATAIRWFQSVPAPYLRRHHQGTIALVVMQRFVGNAATVDALLDDLEPRSAPGSRHRAQLDVLRSVGVIWHLAPAEALARAQLALDALVDPTDPRAPAVGQLPDPFLVAVARLGGGTALTHLGRHDEARRWFRAGLDEPFGYPLWKILLLGGLGQVEVEVGNLQLADQCAIDAIEVAEGIGLADHAATGRAYLVRAEVAVERGDPVAALALLGEADIRARRNRRTNLVAAVAIERARALAAAGDPVAALGALRAWRDEREPTPAAALSRRADVAEAAALVATDQLDRAQRVLAGLPHTPDSHDLAARLAVRRGDPAALRQAVRTWPASALAVDRIRHLLWQAVVAGEGRRADAVELVASAVALAGPEGFVRPFQEAGPGLAELVRAVAAASPGSADHLARLVAPSAPRAPAAVGPGGARPLLTRRELGVLALLPTRLSQEEIAGELFISPNTLKTHLRRMYRKLGVTNRLTAVNRARELGLL